MPFETNGGYGIGNCLDVMSQCYKSVARPIIRLNDH
ncbi:hypothetical protein Q7Q91_03800 [Lactiplantibacillus pentosus]|nr:hypothetical protein [Lactiplantibacillus pentosus]MDO7804113.1 hypothetical protein [Lactiplantibacillus pentosus]